jgi:ABC-type Fe3+ transport system substrate-binding protein
MLRNVSIILLLAVIIALPFIFRQPPPQGDWREGDPVIVIVSPHNEAIRYEYAQAFSRWHKQKYGKPVKIDWRNIGGTSEISRYLTGQYTDNTRAWWRNQGKDWPSQATEDLTKATPATPAVAEVHKTYRETDSPDAITSGIDLFFGGGEYDHSAAFRAGFTVPVIDLLPPELFEQDGIAMIPEKVSGETWRTPSVMGNVVSTFGIIYNVDRLGDLGITTPPAQWIDLADYRYFGQVGLADPTKSGSIAKAFEMIVHQQMHDAVVAAGFNDSQIAANEKRIGDFIKQQGKAYKRGDVPEDLKDYQAALEKGFENGLHLIQRIGANARYFTDSASKVPIDVSMGDAAVGMAIDFYGRYQAEASRAPDGTERMKFVTPVGGTSVSCDPISLLRGAGGHAKKESQAETRQAAIRFIEFVLSEEGQRLWCYKPGTTNAEGELIGPEKYALRRLPIRRTFYPSTQPTVQATHLEHLAHSVDNLADPMIDPYAVSEQFVYYPRWTGSHFSVLRDIVRAMCLDSGDELKAAWKTIHMRADYPEYDPPLGPLPTVMLSRKKEDGSMTTEEVPLNWRTAPDMSKRYERIEYMREWTRAFRDTYRKIQSGKLRGTATGELG